MSECFRQHGTVERIIEELGKSRDEIQTEVDNLRNWLKAQKHLPQNAHSDVALEAFLLGCKWDVDKAKKKLDLYFRVRNYMPYVYSNRDPLCDEIRASNRCCQVCALPALTADGARVFSVRLIDPDPSAFELVPALRRVFNLLDLVLATDPLVYKVYIIVDTQHATFNHMLKLSPQKIKDSVYCIQSVYPYQILGIIFLNVNSFLRVMIQTILKPLFKRKISKRIHVYSSGHKKIDEIKPQSILPREYNGDGPSLNELNQRWISFCEKHRDFLMTAGTAVSNEVK